MKFGLAEALRDMGPEIPERGSKTLRCQSFEQNLNFFRRDPNDFLSQLVTMDETWLYHYDPEPNQQSMGGSIAAPPPQRIPNAKIRWKISRLDFWDQDGILLIDYLPKYQPINAEYYASLLVQLKEIWKEKSRWNIAYVVLFLHDNAPSHRALATQTILANLGFQCLDHPSYSPDLAPSDYHLFCELKNQLKGRHFSSDSEVIAAAETLLDGQFSEVFF